MSAFRDALTEETFYERDHGKRIQLREDRERYVEGLRAAAQVARDNDHRAGCFAGAIREHYIEVAEEVRRAIRAAIGSEKAS